MVVLRGAFLFSVERSHLWVVISAPDGARSQFVMVNMTTLDNNVGDESCILDHADYPEFNKHPTVINYKDARLWWTFGENGYEELLASNMLVTKSAVSPYTLLRIQQGALQSDFLVPDYKALVQDSLVALPGPVSVRTFSSETNQTNIS